MPHSPSGGGSIAPPIMPCPRYRVSMNDLRSRVSDIARLISGLSKGGLSRFDEEISRRVGRDNFADRLRYLVLHILDLWDRHPVDQVALAADKGERARRQVLDDRIFDAVEIGSPRLPVIRVAGHRNRLVWLEIDEFERAGADRVLPHFARRDVARIHR